MVIPEDHTESSIEVVEFALCHLASGDGQCFTTLGDEAVKEGFSASHSSTRKIRVSCSIFRNFLNPLKYFSTNTRASMVEDF
jgi:hypothetical protein